VNNPSPTGQNVVSIRLKLILLLTGSFVLLAPLSVAPGVSFAEPAKYFRLLVTMLIVGIGLIPGDQLRLGAASRMLTAFAIMFSLSGGWSDSPIWGLFNKGMFGLTCFSGTVLACSLRTPGEMRSALRFLGIVSAAAALVSFVLFLMNPSQTSSLNRMAIFGINPNTMGHAAVPLAVLCMYVAINDNRRLWKALMVGACCILGLIIIATGCRGAALTMVIGTACLIAPYSRRPGVLLGVLVGAAFVGYLGFEVMDIGGNDRLLSEVVKDNRGPIWRFGMRNFEMSPLIGRGWLHYGSRSLTVLSIYIQTLAETGLIGAALLVGTLLVVANRWFDALVRLKRLRLPTGVCYLALALLLVELVHGITESSPFVGTNMACLVFGLGIGLVDRAAELGIATRSQVRQVASAATLPQVRRRLSAREVLDAMQQNTNEGPACPPS
jgi:O-antigen ligase